MTAPQQVSPRLQQFQAEVDQLRVTGGRANPERTGMIIGAVLIVVGLVLGIYAYVGLSHPTTNPLQQGDATVVGLLGVSCAVIGTGLFVVFSSPATSATGWCGSSTSSENRPTGCSSAGSRLRS